VAGALRDASVGLHAVLAKCNTFDSIHDRYEFIQTVTKPTQKRRALLQQNAVLKQQILKRQRKLQKTPDTDRTSPSREWVERRRTLKEKHSRVGGRYGHWRNSELIRHKWIWRYRCSRPRGGADERAQRAGAMVQYPTSEHETRQSEGG
jgi:hypothetical protein